MKKILTLFFALMMVFEGFSQTYYSWNFATATTSTFPAGFVTWKLDGQTVSTSLSSTFNNAGWVLFPAANGAAGVAATTSWFTNTSVACDRWLVTPPMNIPAATPNVCLMWSIESADPSFPDGYEVKISTTDSATTSFTATPITITAENGAATTRLLPLAAYAGQTIRVAFRDISTNEYVLLMHSIKLVNLPSNAAHISDVEIYEHNYLNNPVDVTGINSNTGFDTINTFTMNYSVNGAAPVTAPVTGAGLVPQNFYYYTHPTQFNPSTAGTYTISVWFSNINGSGASSDTSSVTIFYYPQVAGLVKNVLVEEMTGAGCPWCPGGALALRDVAENLSYVVPVAIHSADINDLSVTPADAMQITDGETVCSALGTGYPSGMVDRLYSFDNQSVSTSFANDYYRGPSNVTSMIWDTMSIFRKAQATPVNVSLSALTFDSTVAANNLTVTVNANFLNSLSQGSYRLNLYVVEDSLITTGNGYDQDNAAYSSAGGQTTNYNELFNLPSLLINNGQQGEYSQNHVLRAMVGGAWGLAGDIPSAPMAGSTYSHTFTTTVPATWRYKYIKLVGVVQEYNTSVNKRTVLNVAEIKLISNPNGIKETAQYSNLSVYPNPASTMATVQMDMKENAMVTISLVNSLGQVVVEPTDALLNAGSHSLNIHVGGLETGLYFVKVAVDGTVNTIPLTVTAK